ncbi:MAG: lipoyl(octanoyl) transferase LipB [Deltaproteobacteria bacterium]|nr:lipoyl(octanoyl) transferase LipB [Deltaproteobacteria bacterium]
MAKLINQDLGSLEYQTALTLQEKLVESKQREPSDDILLFVEHPHIYTLGRGGKETNVLAPREVPVYRSSRGGDVTYHGPGQLVVYPIIDLRSKLRKDVHRYVRNLEMSAISTLKDFGLSATRRPPYTGIWINDRKIAAIGVAVKRSITYHGLALNVNTDLSYFQRIVPCGLTWADVTSLQKELGAAQNMNLVKVRFLHNFAKVFGYPEVQEPSETPSKPETRNSELETI